MTTGAQERELVGRNVVLVYLAPPDHASYPAPPYGLELIAAALRDFPVRVTIADPFLHHDPPSYAAQLVRARAPLVVGLSLRNLDNLAHVWGVEDADVRGIQSTSFVEVVRPVVEAIKAQGSPVVIGGSGFSAAPAECLRALGLHYGVAGPGELAFRQLVEDCLEKGAIDSHARVPGLVVRGADDSVRWLPSDTAGVPRTWALPGSRSWDDLDASRPVDEVPVRVSVGCTAHCIFCVERRRPVSVRPVHHVVDELARAADAGHRRVFLTASELNIAGEDPLLELCAAIVDAGLHDRLSFRGYFNPAPCSPRLLDALLEAGFDNGGPGVTFTATHLTDSMLQALGRRHRMRDLESLARNCVIAGLQNLWLGLILGGPGESWESLRQCVDGIERLSEIVGSDRLKIRYNCGVRVYPHTPLATLVRRRGEATFGWTDPTFLDPVVTCEPVGPRALTAWVEDATRGLAADVRSFNRDDDSSPWRDERATALRELRLGRDLHRMRRYDSAEVVLGRARDVARLPRTRAAADLLIGRCASATGARHRARGCFEDVVATLDAQPHESLDRRLLADAHQRLATLCVLAGEHLTAAVHRARCDALSSR